MSAEIKLWFRRPSGEVFSLSCHPELVKAYTKFYTGDEKGFTLLPGEPTIAVVKGDLAPDPEPAADAPQEHEDAAPAKRGPGRPHR